MRIAFLIFLASAAASSAPTLPDNLCARISGFSGTISVYAKNLDAGVSVGIRETDPVRTASTIKLPILPAVFDAVSRGQTKWTEALTLTDAEKRAGSAVLGSESSGGVALPFRDALNLMMVLSDNTATNMALERSTADAVNAYLDTIGIKTIRSMRKVRGDRKQLKSPSGYSAAGKLPENQKYGLGVSTPRDMVTILEKLERGEIVNAEASRQIIAIMKRCRDDSGIRRRASDVPVANKTGALDALRSDVGIVYSKGGRIAMAITVDDMPKIDYGPDNAGCLLIAELAQMLVDGLAKK